MVRKATPIKSKVPVGFIKCMSSRTNTFILDRDIDGNGCFEAIGANGTPFKGTFDGLGHTITDVMISQAAQASLPLMKGRFEM